MTDLLTRAEYQAIADSLTPPKAAFIDGKFRAGKGAKLKTVNPATGKTIATIAACNDKDVDLAVAKAREAFDQGHWAKLHPSERKDTLIRLAKLMTRNRRELAVLESTEAGKPIRDCELIDIPDAIHCIKWHAEAIDKIYDQTSPTGDDAISMIVREPIGVVAAILPWNFPLLMMAWKIGPALAAGCSVIVKPAEQTSLTALRLAELASDAGLPKGVCRSFPALARTWANRWAAIPASTWSPSPARPRRAAVPEILSREQPQESRPRMRRQEPGRGAVGCREPRPRGGTHYQCRLLERGPELLRRLPPDRPQGGEEAADRQHPRPDPRLENR